MATVMSSEVKKMNTFFIILIPHWVATNRWLQKLIFSTCRSEKQMYKNQTFLKLGLIKGDLTLFSITELANIKINSLV